jgi:hypothetical protein
VGAAEPVAEEPVGVGVEAEAEAEAACSFSGTSARERAGGRQPGLSR